MIISKARERDRKFRTLLLENMELGLKSYERKPTEEKLDYVKHLGKLSEQFKERIRTHDYTLADQEIAHQDEMDRRMLAVLNNKDIWTN